MRITKNRKGLGTELKDIILYSVIIIIGMAFLFTYLLRGAGKQIDDVQKCSVLAVGNGVCRETCETDELPHPGLGCEGVAGTCCVSTSKNENDVILPAAYGGNSDYNFKIEYIGIAESDASKIGQCQFDNVYNTSLRCISGQRITIPVKVAVNNTGGKVVAVKSKPVMVMNDNPERISQQYVSSAPTAISMKETKEIVLSIVLTESNSEENSYYKIYPYALCDDEPCRATDQPRDRGVLRKISGDGTYLTVKFVRTLN